MIVKRDYDMIMRCVVLNCFFHSGTESETRAFVAVCIEAIKKQDLSDLKTPQFIFERLANIIYPVC